jgi:hypothetical protein
MYLYVGCIEYRVVALKRTLTVSSRVARWFIFKPKIFGMENASILYDHLEYFAAIWYNLWPFGSLWSFSIFFPIWYVWTKEKSGNPAPRRKSETLLHSELLAILAKVSGPGLPDVMIF